jgi:hypothetical protein
VFYEVFSDFFCFDFPKGEGFLNSFSIEDISALILSFLFSFFGSFAVIHLIHFALLYILKHLRFGLTI